MVRSARPRAPRHLPVGEDEVVAAGRRVLATASSPECKPIEGPSRAADDRESVRIAFLRHEHARPAVTVGEGHVVELLARPDLQILGELGLGHHQAGRGADHVEQPIGLPHGVPGVLGDAPEAQQGRDVPAVGAQPGAVDAACPARAGIGPLQRLAQPTARAQHRVGEREDIVAERGRLRVLQVGLVGHQRAGVRAGLASYLGRERGGGLDEAGEVSPQAQPERDPDRLPPGASRVQPAGHVASPLGEVLLAGVVRLAVGGVVGKLAGRDRHGVEHQHQHAAGRGRRDHPRRAKVEQVREIGEVDPVVQYRGVGVLQREPGRDQLRGRRPGRRPGRRRPGWRLSGRELGWRAGSGARARWHGRHRSAPRAAATTSSWPPVCQNTTGPAPRWRATSDSALAV